MHLGYRPARRWRCPPHRLARLRACWRRGVPGWLHHSPARQRHHLPCGLDCPPGSRRSPSSPSRQRSPGNDRPSLPPSRNRPRFRQLHPQPGPAIKDPHRRPPGASCPQPLPHRTQPPYRTPDPALPPEQSTQHRVWSAPPHLRRPLDSSPSRCHPQPPPVPAERGALVASFANQRHGTQAHRAHPCPAAPPDHCAHQPDRGAPPSTHEARPEPGNRARAVPPSHTATARGGVQRRLNQPGSERRRPRRAGRSPARVSSGAQALENPWLLRIEVGGRDLIGTHTLLPTADGGASLDGGWAQKRQNPWR